MAKKICRSSSERPGTADAKTWWPSAVPPMLRSETSPSARTVPSAWKRSTAQTMTGRIMYSRGQSAGSGPRYTPVMVLPTTRRARQEGRALTPAFGGEVADGFPPGQDRRRAEDQEARDVAHVPGHEHRRPGPARQQARQRQARAADPRAQERGQQGDVGHEARGPERGKAELSAVRAVFQGPGGEEGFGGVAQGGAQRAEHQREGGSRPAPARRVSRLVSAAPTKMAGA